VLSGQGAAIVDLRVDLEHGSGVLSGSISFTDLLPKIYAIPANLENMCNVIAEVRVSLPAADHG
jgi:hypothetical protein